MNRRTKLIVAVLALVLGVPALSGDDAKRKAIEEPDKTKELMHKKLENAQKLLEGIAINDFDKILKHTEELMAISKSLEWKVLKTPRYELHSNQFRSTLEELTEKAKEKNLDGVALGYVELTLTCVKCHKHVREKRFTLRDPEEVDGYGLHALSPQPTFDKRP